MRRYRYRALYARFAWSATQRTLYKSSQSHGQSQRIENHTQDVLITLYPHLISHSDLTFRGCFQRRRLTGGTAVGDLNE